MVRKLINHGAWVSLTNIIDTRGLKVDISSIQVVKEFNDVFFEELLGLPPVREIRFGIELELETTMISTAL